MPDRGYTPGAQGAAPQKNDFKIPEWPTKKGSGGSGHTRHTVRRIPRQAERNNGEREKAVVRPNGCSKKGAIRHKRLDGQYPSLKASHLGTWAPSCKSACKRRALSEVRAGTKLGAATRRGLPETRRRGDSRTLAGYCNNQPGPRWGALHWFPQGFCHRRPCTGRRRPFSYSGTRLRLRTPAPRGP